MNALTIDLDQEKDIQSALEEMNKPIHALVNCAGLIHSQPLINLMDAYNPRQTTEQFVRILNANLTTGFTIGAHVAENMVMNRTEGVIINFSSISARGNAGQSAYSAAKAGLESLTKVWAKELGAFGIRCVAIAPGFIDTPSTHAALSQSSIDHIISNTPLRKMGRTDNIAMAVDYALNNDFVTGTVLEVDGGLHI